MKIFTVGPVAMYSQTFEITGRQTPYFRTKDFSKIMLETEEYIYKLLNAPKGSKTVFLTTSGTGAMEASLINLAKPEDKFLVINGGVFGYRFSELCDIHHIKHERLDLAFGETLTASHLEAYKNKGITGILVNIHETSTGQLYDIKMLSEFCKQENLLFIIDAISSFLADPLDMSKIDADAIIFSSHKAMALNPGISCVVISPKAYEERVKGNKIKVLYLDFNNHIDGQVRGQTPFTPAVNVALTMNDMLGSICKLGVETKINQTRELALDFRNKAKAIKNIEIPTFPLSNALTTLVFSDEKAQKIHEILCNEYSLMLTPNGGELADRVLRVGHIGNHTIVENDEIISAIKEIYEKELLT